MILDTSFLLDLLNNDSGAVNKVKELEKNNTPLFTTSISVFEIWQGSNDIKNLDKKNKILDLLDTTGKLMFDFESAKIGGEIHTSLIKKGQMIDPEDSMIAGVALNRNDKILTRNVKHFSRVDNLKEISY